MFYKTEHYCYLAVIIGILKLNVNISELRTL